MENKTVSRWINQSEKKNRTVSLWINQSEDVPCQRVRKRDIPAKQENRRRTVSTGIGEILLYFKWRNFLSNKIVFIEEIQKVTDYIF